MLALQTAVIPESVLKKRKRKEKWQQEKAAEDSAASTQGLQKKQEILTRAESYIKEYHAKKCQLVQMKRVARANGTFYVEPEAKLLFVMRLRGINGMHPKTRHIMQVLRLLQINNGVFMRVNKATMNMLVKVDPYIMYGYPNLKTVLCCHLLCKPFEGNNTCRHRQLCVGSRQHSFYSYATLVQFRPRSPSQVKDLVYKRGFAKVGGQRVPLTNNCIIEKALDQKTKGAVMCMEDLIHEIYTVGPFFMECTKFLWPFKMNCPIGGFSRIRNHFVESGDAGNREEYVNELIRRML